MAKTNNLLISRLTELFSEHLLTAGKRLSRTC